MERVRTLVKVSEGEWKRFWLHFPVGVLTCLFGYYVGWWLALIFGAGFGLYEVDEDWHLSDRAYKDIKGWLWGLGVTGVVLFVMGIILN